MIHAVLNSLPCWNVKDANITKEVVNHLSSWINVVEGRADNPTDIPVILTHGRSKDAWEFFYRNYKRRPTLYRSTICDLRVDLRTSLFSYNRATANISILSEVLLLLISLEDKDTEWSLLFTSSTGYENTGTVLARVIVRDGSRNFDETPDLASYSPHYVRLVEGGRR